MFPAMRRWKQQLTQQACVELLKQEPRGVLSLMGEDGYPYGLPISYWYCEADGKIYFHAPRADTRSTPSGAVTRRPSACTTRASGGKGSGR